MPDIERLGRALGVVLQMADDYHDILVAKQAGTRDSLLRPNKLDLSWVAASRSLEPELFQRLLSEANGVVSEVLGRDTGALLSVQGPDPHAS